MLEPFRGFDQAFERSPVAPSSMLPPLRRRKTFMQKTYFLLANLIIMPILMVVYATIIADGLRVTLPIFQRKLYTLPVPGLGLLRQYDGWNRADLSIVVSLLLFVALTWLWMRVISELQGFGTILQHREQSPYYFYLVATIAGVIILGDAALFWAGIQAQSAGGWNEVPEFVAPLATLLYTCGVAAVGAWHADHRHSSHV